MKVRKIRSESTINAPLKLVWETMFDKENTPAWSTMFQEYKTFGWSGPFITKYLFSDDHRFFLEEISATQTKIVQTDEMIGLLKGLVPESLYTNYNQALKLEAEKRYSLKNK